MADYVEALRSTIPYVHPAARVDLHFWMMALDDAITRNDTAEVTRLIWMIESTIRQELRWQEEDAERAS
jgi:hypothetical protein